MSNSASSALEEMTAHINALRTKLGDTFCGAICQLINVCRNPIGLSFSIRELRFNNFVKTQERIAIMNLVKPFALAPKGKCFTDILLLNDRHMVAIKRLAASYTQ